MLEREGLKGERLEGLTGVWVQDKKIAAIGMNVSRSISLIQTNHHMIVLVNITHKVFYSIGVPHLHD